MRRKRRGAVHVGRHLYINMEANALRAGAPEEAYPEVFQVLCQRNNVSFAGPAEIPRPDLQWQRE